MSLYTKPIGEITFEDVEAYCNAATKPREGLMLDFKSSFPNDLPKLLTSFANTAGGIVIFGVNGDQNNEPEWPPVGAPAEPQNSERINQASFSSYPPVHCEVSRMFPLPSDPARVIFIVRIAESPVAPHAVGGGRRIYERIGDTANPIDHASIERIERLLKRRWRIEDDRERLLNSAMERACRYLQDGSGPRRWVCVSPLFPSVPVCTLDECLRTHQQHHVACGTPVGAPGGSFALRYHGFDSHRRVVATTATNLFGQVFLMEISLELLEQSYEDNEGTHNGRYLHMRHTDLFAHRAFEFAQAFCATADRYDGLVRVCFGIRDCRGIRMISGYKNVEFEVGPAFPDNDYRSDVVIHSAELADERSAWKKYFRPDLEFCFGVH